MSGSGPISAVAFVGVLASLVASSVGLLTARDYRYAGFGSDEQTAYVTSGEGLRDLASPLDAVLADVYWIRALQHFGRGRRAESSPRYDRLYSYLDIATTLDPRFTSAYHLGAIFLAEPYPGGPGRPDQAIALLEKGRSVTPERWQYLHDIGFVHYWWLHDYRTAAEWFDRASQMAGAPWWLRSLAAATLAQGGDRRASRVLWQTILESAENEWVRRDAARRLVQIDALEEIDRLSEVVQMYVARGGETPLTWARIVSAGLLPSVPNDPAGVAYDLAPYSGTVGLADDSPLGPLPSEPPALPAPPR